MINNEYFDKPTELTDTTEDNSEKKLKDISDTINKEIQKSIDNLGKTEAYSKFIGYVHKQD